MVGIGQVCSVECVISANDPTVKAGSWGPKTVEKIIRIQERALQLRIPMVYLVDSAGARITDQVQMFPGRRGAGRIFRTQVRASGSIPQVCALFGVDTRALTARIRTFETAFGMQLEAPEAFDITRETDETLKLYGIDEKPTDEFGRQCLFARRFAEAAEKTGAAGARQARAGAGLPRVGGSEGRGRVRPSAQRSVRR